LRKRLGVAEEVFLVTFVSEPLSSDYGDDGAFWGFTEKTIFSSFLATLERCVERSTKGIHLVVKQHPREVSGNLDDLLERELGSFTVTIDRSSDPMELIHASDLVCGMSSMMLIEAAIIGKPVLSMMMGLKRENPFVLDRRGIIRSARTDEEVEKLLYRALLGEPEGLGKFEVIQNPVKAIIGEMERMLS
jgi:UDP-N-acetylglucosamine 2-epimerase